MYQTVGVLKLEAEEEEEDEEGLVGVDGIGADDQQDGSHMMISNHRDTLHSTPNIAISDLKIIILSKGMSQYTIFNVQCTRVQIYKRTFQIAVKRLKQKP